MLFWSQTICLLFYFRLESNFLEQNCVFIEIPRLHPDQRKIVWLKSMIVCWMFQKRKKGLVEEPRRAKSLTSMCHFHFLAEHFPHFVAEFPPHGHFRQFFQDVHLLWRFFHRYLLLAGLHVNYHVPANLAIETPMNHHFSDLLFWTQFHVILQLCKPLKYHYVCEVKMIFAPVPAIELPCMVLFTMRIFRTILITFDGKTKASTSAWLNKFISLFFMRLFKENPNQK